MQFCNGTCPYCQQSLPSTFLDDIENVFDAQYDADIAALSEFRNNYQSKGRQIWQTLKNNQEDVFPKINLDTYNAKIESYINIMQLNLAEIDKKIKEPTLTVELEDTDALLEEINQLIARFNALIKENNGIFNNKQAAQTDCTEKVWKHIAYLTSAEVKKFKALETDLKTNIATNNGLLTTAQAESTNLAKNISELSKSVVSTQNAVANINILLKESGFEGFNIQEKPDQPNTYQVVRDNGDRVTRLSEGERNFIAFMYFYQLVKGSDSDDGTSKPKIVVIDDPVSSMDSIALFIVSALVREMIDITLNRFDLDYENNAVQGFYIKQFLVLTHNAYFHREISYRYVSNFQYVNLFLIKKVNNISSVDLKIEQNPDEPGQMQNVNPIQNSYSALWEEYAELERFAPLMNVIHRILDYYFLQLCGYDGMDSPCASK